MLFSNASNVLTSDQLASMAPAIYAQGAAPSRKETYGFVSTAEVLNTLAEEGWHPTSVAYKNARTAVRRAYGSHTLRLRHVNAEMMRIADGRDSVPEIVFRNGHDGSSAVKLDFGVFCGVCANGLVVMSQQYGGLRLCHSQYAADKVRAGVASMLSAMPRLGESIEAMRAVTLSVSEQTILAESALRLRWEENAPVDAHALITARRDADMVRANGARDLWTTFNVIQEHLIRGGDNGRNASGRRMRTRGVKAADASHKLNRELWALAEGMARLKA